MKYLIIFIILTVITSSCASLGLCRNKYGQSNKEIRKQLYKD